MQDINQADCGRSQGIGEGTGVRRRDREAGKTSTSMSWSRGRDGVPVRRLLKGGNVTSSFKVLAISVQAEHVTGCAVCVDVIRMLDGVVRRTE